MPFTVVFCDIFKEEPDFITGSFRKIENKNMTTTQKLQCKDHRYRVVVTSRGKLEWWHKHTY